MEIIEKKVIFDAGLEVEFGEKYEDVKGKFEKFEKEIYERNGFVYLQIKELELFTYKVNLELYFNEEEGLDEILVKFIMPVYLGQSFDTRDELHEANKQHFQNIKSKVSPLFSSLSFNQYNEKEYSMSGTTDNVAIAFNMDRDFEGVYLGISDDLEDWL
ncbi:MAG: hypothetical protein K5769_06050 [Pseudobutyrivibrio sp.]|nr:hypothetical protein [Pseudobutyrivibrio sp.]